MPRIKALTKLTESAEVTVEPVPELSINYIDEKLSGFIEGEAYIINGELYTADSLETSVRDEWFGTVISVIKVGKEGISMDSEAQTISVASRPASPVLSVRSETASGKNDGRIDGVSADMEYRRNDADNNGSGNDNNDDNDSGYGFV